jgi:hypothetical protein
MPVPPQADWPSLPRTASEARAKGVKLYWDGTACGRGHRAIRRAYDKRCVECLPPPKAKWPSLPRTDTEAKASGSMFFWTGKPCKRGHDSVRWVNGGGCFKCQRERAWERNPTAQSLGIGIAAYAKASGFSEHTLRRMMRNELAGAVLADGTINKDFADKVLHGVVPVPARVYAILRAKLSPAYANLSADSPRASQVGAMADAISTLIGKRRRIASKELWDALGMPADLRSTYTARVLLGAAMASLGRSRRSDGFYAKAEQ